MSGLIGLLVDAPKAGDNSIKEQHANEQREATADSRLRQSNVDIIFNRSTGTRGESRQSQVPAILEMLGIPYIGSGILAHGMAHNKAVAAPQT